MVTLSMLHYRLVSLLPLATPVEPPGFDKIDTIINWLMWGVFTLAVAGVLITAGVMMVNNRRGEGGEHAQRLGWVLFGCILASAASALVAALK